MTREELQRAKAIDDEITKCCERVVRLKGMIKFVTQNDGDETDFRIGGTSEWVFVENDRMIEFLKSELKLARGQRDKLEKELLDL